MIDLGTGNNNKINWPLTDKQEFIDIVETVYRGARKGRGLVVAPKDYSTKYVSLFVCMRRAYIHTCVYTHILNYVRDTHTYCDLQNN
jgi:hypothetical protein